jgi:hypothetical protein
MDAAEILLYALALVPLLGLLGSAFLPLSLTPWASRVSAGVALVSLLGAGFLLLDKSEIEILEGWARLDSLSWLFALVFWLGVLAREFFAAPSSGRALPLVRALHAASGALVLLTPNLVGLWAGLVLSLVATAVHTRRATPGGEERAKTLLQFGGLGLGLSLLGLIAFLWYALRKDALAESPIELAALAQSSAGDDFGLLRAGVLLFWLGVLPLAGSWPGLGLWAKSRRGASPEGVFSLSLLLGSTALYVVLRVFSLYAHAASPAAAASLPAWVASLTLLAVLFRARSDRSKEGFAEILAPLSTGFLLWGLGLGGLGGVQAGLLFWLFGVFSHALFVAAPPGPGGRLAGLGLAGALGLPPLASVFGLWSLLLAGLESRGQGDLFSGVFGEFWATLRHLLFGAGLLGLWWLGLPLALSLLFPRTTPQATVPRSSGGQWLIAGLCAAFLLLPWLYFPESLDSLIDQAARLALGE